MTSVGSKRRSAPNVGTAIFMPVHNTEHLAQHSPPLLVAIQPQRRQCVFRISRSLGIGRWHTGRRISGASGSSCRCQSLSADYPEKANAIANGLTRNIGLL